MLVADLPRFFRQLPEAFRLILADPLVPRECD
jgi:hypothetical protein